MCFFVVNLDTQFKALSYSLSLFIAINLRPTYNICMALISFRSQPLYPVGKRPLPLLRYSFYKRLGGNQSLSGALRNKTAIGNQTMFPRLFSS
jgi:hypothetical protein